MPQRILCKNCDEVLYVGELLKSPQDIFKKFDGKCPVCGKDLSFDPEAIKVKPIEQ